MTMQHEAIQNKTAFLDLGFRPFFLGAGYLALTFVLIWAVSYFMGFHIPNYYDPMTWHGHEIIFGFTIAVIAGFLLTAVRNWTGIRTLQGKWLGGLAGLWVLGRVLPFFPALPAWLIASVDLAFLPLLGVALAIPLLKSNNKRNFFLLPLLAVFTLANALVHLQILKIASSARLGLYLAVHLILLLIVVIAGRIMPLFTGGALNIPTPVKKAWLEKLAILSILGLAVAELLSVSPQTIGGLAAFAALIHGWRWAYWHRKEIWKIPLLWTLHMGYVWLVIGLALKSLSGFGLVSPFLALHALTVGVIGGLTLSMMARVSLGHTGRPLVASPSLACAFVLLYLAAAVRAFFPIFAPQLHRVWILSAGLLWVGAFGIFSIYYTPVLFKPRVDGKPL